MKLCHSQFGLLQQKYHRLASLNNQHLLLTVLEAEKSKIKELADSLSDEGLLSGSRHLPSHVSSHGGRNEGVSLGSLFLNFLFYIGV